MENIIRFILAFLEIGLCYFTVINTVLDWKSLLKREKVALGSVCLILSALLYINRKVLFVSYSMLWVVVIVTTFIFWMINRRKFKLILGIVLSYNLLITLIEMILAFFCMFILKSGFENSFFWHIESGWRDFVFLISFLLSLIIISCFIKWYKKTGIELKTFENTILIMDVVLYIVFRIYQTIMCVMIDNVQEIKGISAGISLFAILVIFTFVIVLYTKYRIVDQEYKTILVCEELYRKNYREIETVLEKNRRIVHDIHNHMIVMKELIEKDNIGDLKNYIDEVDEEFTEITYIVRTKNRILDIILNQKIQTARDNDIQFTIECSDLPKLKMMDLEICTLFGNLIDNALDACQEMKEQSFIDFKTKVQDNMLFIKIKNSIAEVPRMKDGELVTTKEEKELHGYGMKSVKRIVNKYEGVISYNVQADYFEVIVSFFDIV